MSGFLTNKQGEFSGAKIVLLLACFLTAAWLLRDLINGTDINEWHTLLLGSLVGVGTANRISARKNQNRYNNDEDGPGIGPRNGKY